MTGFLKKDVKGLSSLGFMLTAAALLFMSPRQAAAQINLGDALGKMIAEQFSKGFEAAAKRKVDITPISNTLNDSTKEIVLELHHQSDETITAKLTIGNNPNGGRVVEKAADSSGAEPAKKKPSLLDEEENKKDTSSISYKPMADWIVGLPETITVAPGEKKKIKLTVKIPPNAAPGEYAAWIATDVAPSEKATMKIPVFAVAKLVYKK